MIHLVRSKILGFVDQETVGKLEANMAIHDYDVRKGVTIEKVVKTDAGLEVTLSDGTVETEVDHVL